MPARRLRRLLALALLASCFGGAGCASLFRGSAREATQGALAGAAEGVRVEDVSELTSQITIGVIRGLARAAEDPTLSVGIERIVGAVSRGVIAGVVAAADPPGEEGRRPVAGRAGQPGQKGEPRGAGQLLGGAAADALLARRGAILSFAGALSAEVGRGLARGFGEEAGRVTAAAVRGALDTAASAVPCDPGVDRELCLQRFARGLSRASALGASEAVQQKASPWPSVVAFALGAMTMLLLLAAWRTVARRHGGTRGAEPAAG